MPPSIAQMAAEKDVESKAARWRRVWLYPALIVLPPVLVVLVLLCFEGALAQAWRETGAYFNTRIGTAVFSSVVVGLLGWIGFQSWQIHLVRRDKISKQLIDQVEKDRIEILGQLSKEQDARESEKKLDSAITKFRDRYIQGFDKLPSEGPKAIPTRLRPFQDRIEVMRNYFEDRVAECQKIETVRELAKAVKNETTLLNLALAHNVINREEFAELTDAFRIWRAYVKSESDIDDGTRDRVLGFDRYGETPS